MPPLFTYVATTATLLGLIALAVAAVVASRRYEGRHNRVSEGLWSELVRAHGLSRHESRLLRRAAARASLDPESLIFVEPHAVRRLRDDPAEPVDARELLARLYD